MEGLECSVHALRKIPLDPLTPVAFLVGSFGLGVDPFWLARLVLAIRDSEFLFARNLLGGHGSRKTKKC